MNDERRCHATNRRGERCGQWAIRGGRVCKTHGGSAPRARAAADRRLAQAQAEVIVSNTVAARGPLTMRDVYAEMAKTAGLAVAWRDLLETKVAALADWRYEAKGAGAEQLRAEVALFERALDRTGRLLEVIARLDLDARAEKIATQEGQRISGAVKQALARVPDLTQDQRDVFDTAMATEFRALIEPPGTL